MAGPALALLFMGAPWVVPPPSADPLGDLQPTAEEAVAQHRMTGGQGARDACVASDEEEILVCGRTDRRFRSTFPPIPGERRRLVAGEPPSAAAVASGFSGLGGPRGSIDVVNAMSLVGRGLRRILGRD